MNFIDVDSYSVRVFVPGDKNVAEQICQEYCAATGVAVTVTPTTYVYSNVTQKGVIVEIVNFAKEPRSNPELWTLAVNLGEKLMRELGEESYTVQDSKWSRWVVGD